eukprot:1696326-Amphidinium_carterae.1
MKFQYQLTEVALMSCCGHMSSSGNSVVEQLTCRCLRQSQAPLFLAHLHNIAYDEDDILKVFKRYGQ